MYSQNNSRLAYSVSGLPVTVFEARVRAFDQWESIDFLKFVCDREARVSFVIAPAQLEEKGRRWRKGSCRRAARGGRRSAGCRQAAGGRIWRTLWGGQWGSRVEHATSEWWSAGAKPPVAAGRETGTANLEKLDLNPHCGANHLIPRQAFSLYALPPSSTPFVVSIVCVCVTGALYFHASLRSSRRPALSLSSTLPSIFSDVAPPLF